MTIQLSTIEWDADADLHELPLMCTLNLPDDTTIENVDLLKLVSDNYNFNAISLNFEVLN